MLLHIILFTLVSLSYNDDSLEVADSSYALALAYAAISDGNTDSKFIHTLHYAWLHYAGENITQHRRSVHTHHMCVIKINIKQIYRTCAL